jgi:hypothetical protein
LGVAPTYLRGMRRGGKGRDGVKQASERYNAPRFFEKPPSVQRESRVWYVEGWKSQNVDMLPYGVPPRQLTRLVHQRDRPCS